jgi:SAM-dependent methyltransferase
VLEFAAQLKRGRVLDLAGGLGQNALALARMDPRFHAVVADVSDAALAQVKGADRVLTDARTLPFAAASFDTILCFRFYEPRVNFHDLLTPGGTVLFETFTSADAKYRPDFNPAHRIEPATIETLFNGLQLLAVRETDTGQRVVVTVLAKKIGV